MGTVIVKKIVLALFGLAFALLVSSCNDHIKNPQSPPKAPEKECKQHSRKW